MNNKQKSTNKSRARSRNFPVCSLEQAVDNVRILKNKEGVNPTPKNIAVKYWNLSPTSGTGIRMLSALIQFGLLEEEGRGNERRVYPSALANEILENPDKNQRIKASQEAALKPSLFQETWSRYKEQLPSDETLRWELTGGANPQNGMLTKNAVNKFLNSYRTTLEFAKLTVNEVLNTEANDKSIIKGESKIQIPIMASSSLKEEQDLPIIGFTNRTNFDLPIQLGGGVRGTLRLPSSMTPQEWERFEKVIDATKQLKNLLVVASIEDQVGNVNDT